jgi:FSR family fosmidomycin resistance protein-like MFS transporter
MDKLSLSLTRAGFLSTIMQIPSLINPYIGTLADRISMRYFIILAPAMTAVPMSLIGSAPNYTVLLLLLALAGVSVAVFHVPSPVMIAKLSGARKGMGMSFFMVGGELARTLGPLVAVGVVSILGLERFYSIMIFGLLTSGWLFIKFKEIPIRVNHREPTSVRRVWDEMSHILWPLSAILLARGFMHAGMTTFLPIFIRQKTGDLWLAGISLALFEGAGVIGVLAAGSLSDKMGRRKVLFLSLVASPLAVLLFIWLGGWLRFAVLLVTGFTLLSTTPVMLAMVQEHSVSSPAAANGFFMMVSFMARSAIAVIVGFIGDVIGLDATYLISAIIGFCGLPFILMLPKREP